VDDADQTVTIRGVVSSGDSPVVFWGGERLAGASEPEPGPAADTAAGLASMSFITAALRRRIRVWFTAGIIGLVLGGALIHVRPPAYQAISKVYLSLAPYENDVTATQTDAVLAGSQPVGALALQKLGPGSHQTVSGLLSAATVTPLTGQILQIAVKASSASTAQAEAKALTSAFLAYKAQQLRTYVSLSTSALNAQIDHRKAAIATLEGQIATLAGSTPGTVQPSRLAGLRKQLTNDQTALQNLEFSARGSEAATAAGTNTAIRASYGLGTPAPVKHSKLKGMLIYLVSGLIVGLALGAGTVVIQALISDRLRRRDDIAHALGASVRLSVGRVRLHRLLPGRRHGLRAASLPDVRRITGNLRGVLLGLTATDRPGGASLALVTADEPRVAALALAGLVQSCAEQAKKVVLADLCHRAPAARLLGVKRPGVHQVEVHGQALTVVIPARGDTVPTGPLAPSAVSPVLTPPAEEVSAACASAEVLLTLVDLDPMLGSDHLSTWAGDAVVLVTAGKSTWTRVQAVGEMVRLSGVRLVSAVLVEADNSDESLGAAAGAPSGQGTSSRKAFTPGESAAAATRTGPAGVPGRGRDAGRWTAGGVANGTPAPAAPGPPAAATAAVPDSPAAVKGTAIGVAVATAAGKSGDAAGELAADGK
jgi:capsular polysaccharide biosynthesis protein